ncbi:MAG: hypothetical protein WCZ66_06720 [Sphingomonadaceae bacterium]
MVEPFGIAGRVGEERVELRLSRGLRSWPIRDTSGGIIASAHGFLVEGWLGAGLSVANGEIHTTAAISTPADFEKKVIFGLCGLLLFETRGGALGRRLYPDCGGTIPIVYCAENRRFGASANQIFDTAEYDRRLLQKRVDKLVNKEGQAGWISGTLTAHAGTERLLANHYLDLDRFTAHRFWPHEEMLAAPPPTLTQAVETVAHAMEGFVEALAGRHHVTISLTAGVDSRLVLAASRKVMDRISAYTLSSGVETYDQTVPRKMCAALGIHHEILPIIVATADEMEIWDREVGHAARSPNRTSYPTMARIDADMALTGLFGEPARCFLYADEWRTIENAQASPANILARLKQPQDSEQEANVSAWLAPIAHLLRSVILDLAYIELRMSSWGMAQAPIQRTSLWMLMPFAQWSIQNIFLTLPVELRTCEPVLRLIGNRLWPDAMEWPINAYGTWRDRLGPLNKLAQIDGLKTVQRYIRKRMARQH